MAEVHGDTIGLLRVVGMLNSLFKPIPRTHWNEDVGNCLWWRFPIVEPPYVGSLLDEDFPDYVTHWTPIPIPEDPQ